MGEVFILQIELETIFVRKSDLVNAIIFSYTAGKGNGHSNRVYGQLTGLFKINGRRRQVV